LKETYLVRAVGFAPKTFDAKLGDLTLLATSVHSQKAARSSLMHNMSHFKMVALLQGTAFQNRNLNALKETRFNFSEMDVAM